MERFEQRSLQSPPRQLTGLIPPTITPLDEDGRVDPGVMSRLVDFQIRHGASGVFVLGSSGEGPVLPARQRRETVAAAVAGAAGRVPVLAGVLEASTARTLEAAEIAASAGANALVLTTPYYFQADAQASYRHILHVIEGTTLPVVLYNIPSLTHNALDLETILRLAEHPRVVGIKDSSGDMRLLQALIRHLGQDPGFSIFMGHEFHAATALIMGADGLVVGLGNVMPAVFSAMIEAVRRGDHAEAFRLQCLANDVWEIHSGGDWLTGLKWAVHLLGFGSGLALGPHGLATPERQERVKAILQEHGVLPGGRRGMP